jgi:hypothetical protein
MAKKQVSNVEEISEEKVIEKEEKVSKKEADIEKIKAVREKEEKIFSALQNKEYKSLVSDCYTEMDTYVDMAIKNISTGALIEGSGGTGKTYRTLNMALKNLDADEIAYTDSFSTPQAFYIWLYKNREKKLLIVDDCTGVMNNDKVLAFLKGALWDVNGKRLVHYMTTKPLQDETGDYVESSFEMNASIVIITNYLNKKNPHIQAVLSRINYCLVDIPRGELLKILEQISKNSFKELTEEERFEVFSYLKDKTSGSTSDLNIRTLFKMFMFKTYVKEKKDVSPDFWKVLSDKMLKRDDKMALVEKLINDTNFENEDERVKAFTEMTGKGRASYFRLKKQLTAKTGVM